ncbi:MAG: dTDP-4-dehydrorhamnose reductase [Burkholderiales bacterium]|nr:dTDP-4-dehydrorhamnose reductase [Burkholderiales bacterium]
MKILLTGRNGQVGYELERAFAPLGEVFTFDHRQLDLADPAAIVSRVRNVGPDVIVNAAAYTAVDRAESEPETAFLVNAAGPGFLAAEAKALGALLVHYSTDYVYDGTKASPYVETDAPNPLSVYGQSKLAGDRAIQAAGCRYLILRTSWVYGPRGHNFFLTMLRLAREREELRVVDDQRGAPTSSIALAAATAAILRRHGADASGLFHLTAGGETTWFGFSEAILARAGAMLGRTPRLTPITTAEYPAPAKRPANSVFSCAKVRSALRIEMLAWPDQLDEVWEQYRSIPR